MQVYQSILEGQETERKRLAAELHDRVGGTLTGLKWQFDAIAEQLPDQEQADQTRDLINQTYSEVREISHNMAGGLLGKFGLQKAAADLVQAAHRPGRLEARLHTHGMGQRLDADIEIAVYRLLQELISNVLKHANATELVVQLEHIDQSLHLTVSDNGRGFNPDHPKDGLGLANLESRVTDLKGSLNIDSGRGGGTTVMIEIPL